MAADDERTPANLLGFLLSGMRFGDLSKRTGRFFFPVAPEVVAGISFVPVRVVARQPVNRGTPGRRIARSGRHAADDRAKLALAARRPRL